MDLIDLEGGSLWLTTGQEYLLVEVIGRGNHVVYRGRPDDGTPDLAIKAIQRSLVDEEDLNREVASLKAAASSPHPYVIGLLWHLETEDFVFLATPIVGVNLKRFLDACREAGESRDTIVWSHLAGFARDIAAALHHVHQLAPNPVLHRDVKPENILIEGGRAHLIDFGISRLLRPGHDATAGTRPLGSPGVAAPEQFIDAANQSRAVDWWGLGATLHLCLTERSVWPGGKGRAGLRPVISPVIARDFPEFEPFLRQVLKVKPQARIRTDPASLLPRTRGVVPVPRFSARTYVPGLSGLRSRRPRPANAGRKAAPPMPAQPSRASSLRKWPNPPPLTPVRSPAPRKRNIRRVTQKRLAAIKHSWTAAGAWFRKKGPLYVKAIAVLAVYSVTALVCLATCFLGLLGLGDALVALDVELLVFLLPAAFSVCAWLGRDKPRGLALMFVADVVGLATFVLAAFTVGFLPVSYYQRWSTKVPAGLQNGAIYFRSRTNSGLTVGTGGSLNGPLVRTETAILLAHRHQRIGVTVTGWTLDVKGLFVAVRITNHTDQPITVDNTHVRFIVAEQGDNLTAETGRGAPVDGVWPTKLLQPLPTDELPPSSAPPDDMHRGTTLGATTIAPHKSGPQAGANIVGYTWVGTLVGKPVVLGVGVVDDHGHILGFSPAQRWPFIREKYDLTANLTDMSLLASNVPIASCLNNTPDGFLADVSCEGPHDIEYIGPMTTDCNAEAVRVLGVPVPKGDKTNVVRYLETTPPSQYCVLESAAGYPAKLPPGRVHA